MRLVRRGVLVTGMVLALAASGAWADAGSMSADDAPATSAMMGCCSGNLAAQKLGRGLTNAVFGSLEIPWNTYHQYTTSEDRIAGAFTGLAVGLVKGLVRTAVGVYETATFFLPCPRDYAPVLEPLPYFERDP